MSKMNDSPDEIKKRMAEEIVKRSSFPEKPVELTEENFNGFVRDHPFVAVDCYADWCGPCKIMDPIVKELAGELKGKVVFGKLNVDEARGKAMEYGIMSIPTMLIFKDGKLVNKLIGAMRREKLKSELQKYWD